MALTKLPRGGYLVENLSVARRRASPFVLSFGELVWDLYPDERRLGGCAANLAYHSTRLGTHTALVSRVGDDKLGNEARAWLEDAGVDVSELQRDDDAPTGEVSVRGGANPSFEIASLAAWDRIEATPAAIGFAQRASVIAFGTLAQRTPLAGNALSDILAVAAKDTWCLCDLNIRPPFDDANVIERSLRLSNVVKLNIEESERLAKILNTQAPLEMLIDRYGIELVALTRGDNASQLLTADEMLEHPGVPLSTPGGGDAVGAGDAFSAALAHLLSRGASLGAISEGANRYAAHVASFPGAMPKAHDELVRSVTAI